MPRPPGAVGLLQQLFDFVLHLDAHLGQLIQAHGPWVQAILFTIVFCETGLVFTPFLPGDSLLFAVGTFAARQALDLYTSLFVLSLAAILGDTANYWIGHCVGERLLSRGWLNPKHVERTHQFFERYGAKTIVLARFVPIVRTFAPFVAGVGAMTYGKFIAYNVIGGLAWVVSLVLAGYFFGNFPLVKQHFSLVILGIIVVSILPGVVEVVRQRRRVS